MRFLVNYFFYLFCVLGGKLGSLFVEEEYFGYVVCIMRYLCFVNLICFRKRSVCYFWNYGYDLDVLFCLIV